MSIGNLLFSKTRWSKLNTLRQELQQSILNGKTMSSDTPSGKISCHKWDYTATTQIPTDIVERDATNPLRDQHDSSGVTHTRHNYRIARVTNACLYTNNINHRTIYSSNGVSIPELSFAKSRAPTELHLRHPVSRHIPGLTASVFGTVAIASGNYGHWMIDGLSRLLLMQQSTRLSDIDSIATPTFKYDFQQESLKALGFKPEQFVQIPALECVQFDELLCTSAPRGTSSTLCPGWIVDEYRQLIPKQEQTPARKKRLYISRKDASSRNLVNEDEVIAVLEQYDFESIELSKFNFLEKIALFQHAECVVGLTGAGLTNTMFCDKGTKFMELFPPSFVHYLYSSIAAHLNLDYQHLTLKNASSLSRFNKYYGDLHLNTDLLEQSLKKMLA